MHLNTDALIIRESGTGENDRVVLCLTREYGLVRAFARGARKTKSRSQCATGLLTYSRLSIFCGRDAYIIDDAQPIEVFFGLRENIEKLSLAQYFCELSAELTPENDSADGQLRLMLNLLHLLEKGRRPQALLKAVAELRMLALAGYMPDLVACSECGAYEADPMYFLPEEGVLLCPDCGGNGIALTPGLLTAMRHICFSELDRLFAFSLPDESLSSLSGITENYLKTLLHKRFKALEFYKSTVKET